MTRTDIKINERYSLIDIISNGMSVECFVFDKQIDMCFELSCVVNKQTKEVCFIDREFYLMDDEAEEGIKKALIKIVRG